MLHFPVDGICHGSTVRSARAGDESLQISNGAALARRQAHRSQALAHAPTRDHLTCEIGCLLHVIFGAGGLDVKYDLFSCPAAHRTDDARVQVWLAITVPI